MLLPKFNGQLRITFKADSPAVLRQVEQGKHLSGHFEDQCCIIERESLGDSGFGNAVFSDLFNVHDDLKNMSNMWISSYPHKYNPSR